MTTEEKFLAAVDVINSIPYDGTFEPSVEMMLKLYAYEKQAIEGPCNISKPYVWNMSSRAKWSAWNELQNMSREDAMQSYIEELTKVIEAMSYNEKISKFMSLMGPFYEVVSSEEIDFQNDKKDWMEKPNPTSILESYHPPTILELYHMSKNVEEPEKILDSEPSKTHMPENFPFSGTTIPGDYSQSSSTSSDISNFDLLSDLSGAESSSPIERGALNVFRNTGSHGNCSLLSEKDILVLAVINLQSSLEEILKKLDNLHDLAESVNFGTTNDCLQCDGWSLNFTGTAFALLWPVAVELYFSTFRK